MTSYQALGFNPTPGDPNRGEEMARKLRDAADALGQMDDSLSGTGSQVWEGKTASAFYGLVSDDLKPRIKEAHDSFSGASRALDRWLVDLEDYQARARSLEREAEEASSDVRTAQASLDNMGDAPEDDADALNTFENQKTSHQHSLDGKQGALDDIIRRARSLAGEASISATETSKALNVAMDIAPDKPGLFDRLGDAFKDIGEFLKDVAEFVKDNWWDLLHQLVHVISLVLTVASIFFPVLAPFAFGFAIADVAMSGVDWTRGVPGAKEAFLTGAIGLVGGFAAGQVLKGFTEVAGPALAAGPFSVIAQGGTGAIAAPAAAVLAFNPSFGPALAGFAVSNVYDAKKGSDAVVSLMGGNTYYSGKLADGWRKARNN